MQDYVDLTVWQVALGLAVDDHQRCDLNRAEAETGTYVAHCQPANRDSADACWNGAEVHFSVRAMVPGAGVGGPS